MFIGGNVSMKRYIKYRDYSYLPWMDYVSDSLYNRILGGAITKNDLPEIMHAFTQAYSYYNDYDPSALLDAVLDSLYDYGVNLHAYSNSDYSEIINLFNQTY